MTVFSYDAGSTAVADFVFFNTAGSAREQYHFIYRTQLSSAVVYLNRDGQSCNNHVTSTKSIYGNFRISQWPVPANEKAD